MKQHLPWWDRPNALVWLLILHFLFRLYLAWATNLGVDEVYYTQYARDLDYGYFDHAPMVGWLIWLSTLSLELSSDVAVRFSGLVLGSVNLWLMYRMGKLLGGSKAGLLSAVLFCLSIYACIITGVFILPDTGQSFFWLLSLYLLLNYYRSNLPKYLLWFGVTAGFALLSKYHAVFLWVGVGLFVLLYRRDWLKRWEIWVAPLFSVLLFVPVLYWNWDSPWSGFSYHQGRVGGDSFLPNFKYFLPELGGQIGFTHPVVFILIVLALVRIRNNSKDPETKLLLWMGLPLIVTTLLMSMYNKTLPHWSGPGYFSLLLLAGNYWASPSESRFLNKSLKIGLGINLVAVGFVSIQIFTAWPLGNPTPATSDLLGRDDFTTDLAVWNQTGKEVDQWFKAKGIQHPILVTHHWFPGAQLDWYFAQRYGAKLYVFGTVDNQHQYLKINAVRGPIPARSEVWYVTTSIYHMPPDERYARYFPEVGPMHTLTITTKGKPRMNVFLWKLSGNQFPVQVPIFTYTMP